ncbi:flagellar filament capping protein FliD [Deefgea salmonis]|uniref:Flagellar hook-associated protein 2 n=1 Tax=Deefgea salmonis TaxID=2875502 RepID=A0ABS8BGE4_9NEIS|nr:flagellar filament capping protein FliD [Deefgea salmonis]MCB5194786.1 flagellar filament capping protein FliD [Deefgea salmonis]
MALTSSGLGSGLDVAGIVSSLMKVERAPLGKLDTKEAGIQAKISALGTVKGSISALRTAMVALQDMSKFVGLKASSSDSSFASLSVTAGAAAGAYSLEVQELANSQKLTSKSGVFTADSQILATSAALGGKGKITITFGDANGTSAFIPNTTKTPVNIDLDPGSDGNLTLAEVRDQINAKDVGVTASLIQAANGDVRLSLLSKDTGKANGIKIDVAAPGVATDLNKLTYDPDALTAGFEVLAGNEAKDATFILNGVSIQRSSNTIADVVSNATITLNKKTTAAINLEVKSDSASVSSMVDALVKAYNDTNKMLNDASAYNAETKQTAILNGDSTIRSAQTAIRNLLGISIEGTGDLQTMMGIGVSVQRDGSLKFDKSKLEKSIAADPANVAKFFGAYDKVANSTIVPETAKTGIAYQFDQILKRLVDTKGTFDSKVDGLKSSVKNIGQQRELLTRRFDSVEKRYREQFTMLDINVAKMQQTSGWLSQQLANLPKG